MMIFSVITEDEARTKYEKAKNKIWAIQLIADLTASSRYEVAEFLGLKFIDQYPWVCKE